MHDLEHVDEEEFDCVWNVTQAVGRLWVSLIRTLYKIHKNSI
jgi:hypothetical protein